MVCISFRWHVPYTIFSNGMVREFYTRLLEFYLHIIGAPAIPEGILRLTTNFLVRNIHSTHILAALTIVILLVD
jgi:hypothetical protein